MKDPLTDSPAPPPSPDTGEYWSRKLQGNAFTPECCWRAVPQVNRQRIFRETGGSPYGYWAEYCIREFLAGCTPVDRMLSVGCGTGRLERFLARLGAFRECDAWDVAAGAIEAARRLASEEGLSGIHYEVRDVTRAKLAKHTYDAVWFENALHHIEPLEKVCAAVARSLKPGGWLFLNEYIGPSRFAFPPRQRELIRAAFALIPARLRRHRETGTILTAASLPTPAEVEADDPTESVRSADIPEVVKAYFDVVAFHESGGSLLQFLLNGIAGNFRDDDPESVQVIDMLLRLEDELLEIGELHNDFAVFVAHPRPSGLHHRFFDTATGRTTPPVTEEGPATLVSAEEELAQKRSFLTAAEGYARILEKELAQRQTQGAQLEAYARSLEKEVSNKQAHETTVEAYVRSLETEVAQRHAEVASLQSRVHALQSQLGGLQEEVVALRKRLGALEPEVEWRRRPRFHAVTVHHKGRELLEHCLRRLLASQSLELQILVVANACQEPLPAIVEGHASIHVVRSEAVGFAAANNLGVRWAREHLGEPDYWFFVNNDAGVEPDTLRRLADALESTPRAGIAGPQLRIWGAEDHLNSLGLNVTEVGEAWDEGIGIPLAAYGLLPGRREVLAVTGSALLISDEVLRETGGWNELYGYYMEDIDLCLQARSRGWKVVHVPDAVADHAISATADQITDFKRLLSWRNQLLLVLRHWPPGRLLGTGPKLVGGQLKVFAKRLRHGYYDDARLQARSWAGALRLLPWATAQRLRGGGDRSWTRFLRPAGSVPVIHLPEIPPGRRPWEQPAAEGVPAGKELT